MGRIVGEIVAKANDQPASVDTVQTGIEVVARKWGDCEHKRITVDEVKRIVTCKDCESEVDPLAYIVTIAKDWNRYATSVRYLMVEEKTKRAEIVRLVRVAKNLGVRVRRAQLRGHEAEVLPMPAPSEASK